MNKEEPIKAWYFAPAGNRLKYGDNRLVRVGTTHTVEGTPKLCEHGLHASEQIIDALARAESTILYRVELSGEIDRGRDEIAAQSRKYIKRYNVESILFDFARLAAKRCVHLCHPYMPDDAYELVVRWLDTGDESLRTAAGAAARAAASAAARDTWAAEAAWAAMDAEAAWAAMAAAMATARAAEAAGEATVWAAADAEERDWQEQTLIHMISEAK